MKLALDKRLPYLASQERPGIYRVRVLKLEERLFGKRLGVYLEYECLDSPEKFQKYCIVFWPDMSCNSVRELDEFKKSGSDIGYIRISLFAGWFKTSFTKENPVLAKKGHVST